MAEVTQQTGQVRAVLRRVLLVAVCAVLVCGLMGCRPSHKLEKVRYTSSADEVDTEQEQINQEEDGRLEDFLRNIQQEEALDEVDEEFMAAYLANAENNTAAADSRYDSRGADAQASDAAASGAVGEGDVVDGARGEATDADADNRVTTPGGGADSTTGDGTSGEGSSNDSGSNRDDEGTRVEDPEGGDPMDTLPEPVPRATQSTRTMEDESGGEVEIPLRMRKATAVGVAAQLVEMVGGPDRLAGADANLLSNSVAQQVFSDIASVKCWWDGDGSTPISDRNLAYLLADEEIGVVFEIAGQNSFTTAQVEKLAQYGVYYVSLYPFDTMSHLKLNAQIVATAMARSDYATDSASMASRYQNWVDATLADARSKTSSYRRFTTYLAGWDDNVSYKLNSGGFFGGVDPETEFGLPGGRGTGLAYGYTTACPQLFSEAAENANVYNTTTAYDIGHTPTLDYIYVAPVFQLYRVIGGGSLELNGTHDFSTADIMPAYSDHLYVPFQNSGVLPLGQADFPAIVVKSDDVRAKVQSNVFWNYRGYGGITYSYGVYVNPTGLGDWADGSLESPLEATWIAHQFCGQYSESEVKSKLSDFYYQFFGVRLSDEQIAALLNL